MTLDEPSLRLLTSLRDRYFPPARNFLAAHVTLFHALAPEMRERWQTELVAAVRRTAEFPVRIAAPYSLGRGVALAVESDELARLRRELAERWRDFLTPQDRGAGRAHCTIQNKVDPATARETLALMQAEWSPRSAHARGLSLWRYLGGPWAHEADYAFRSVGPGRSI